MNRRQEDENSAMNCWKEDKDTALNHDEEDKDAGMTCGQIGRNIILNRMKEYEDLLQELEQPVSGLEQTTARASSRMVHRNRIFRPIQSTAAAFVLFVLMVNFCTPVANACSRIPVLKELAKAVTFSRSLTDAVDNQYVQPMDLKQTDGAVDAVIEYLIVDQKQVNIFYALDSDEYTELNADPAILEEEGDAPVSCSFLVNGWNVPNGELQSITIDFVDEDVPDSLRLQLDVTGSDRSQEENITAETPIANFEDELFEPTGLDESEAYIAHFDFLLEFDPEFTAAGKYMEVNETVVLDGQQIIIRDVEIYPTHMRVNVDDVPENTAWLKSLQFYVETDTGKTFDPVTGGITATGSGDTPHMSSFRADSSYFYDAKQLKLVITGAEWLRKDMEKVSINLETGETGEMPEGVTFYSAKKLKKGWILELKSVQRKPDHHHQILSHLFYDADGNEYEISSWTSSRDDSEEKSENSYIIETVPLRNFSEDEVWVCPVYSHLWIAEEPVEVKIQ